MQGVSQLHNVYVFGGSSVAWGHGPRSRKTLGCWEWRTNDWQPDS